MILVLPLTNPKGATDGRIELAVAQWCAWLPVRRDVQKQLLIHGRLYNFVGSAGSSSHYYHHYNDHINNRRRKIWAASNLPRSDSSQRYEEIATRLMPVWVIFRIRPLLPKAYDRVIIKI